MRLRSSSFTVAVGIVAAACLSTGCGAMTGLPLPSEAVDASVDAGVDAGLDAGLDASVPCIDVPLDGGPVNAAIRLEAEIGRADVVFLVDSTSSMTGEIDAIRARLRDRIAPAIRAAIPDSQLAVATFADFPVDPYGLAGVDVPFTLMSPSTGDIARTQAAVDSLTLGNGLDLPEAQVEALYQVATGAGLPPYLMASGGCPSGGFGYACIRRDALPVVLLFTDAPMHNGPDPLSSNAYSPALLGVRAHGFDETVVALQSIGAKVIGFNSGNGDPASDGTRDLRSVAVRTGTVDGSGSPLVYQIGTDGERLSQEVVGAIQTFASTVVQDVDAVVRDADPTDGVDARLLVTAVQPVAALPMSGVTSIDLVGNRFVGVIAGTVVTFRLIVAPGVAVPGPEPRFVRVEVIFRGNARTRIGSQIVTLLVPAADGRSCSDLGLAAP